MITCIFGSRSIDDYDMLERVVARSGYEITCVVSGRADGVDRLGEVYALRHRVPVQLFPANWKMYGARAGRIRNARMAEVSECGICMWDGTSPGTRHMLDEMKKKGKPVYLYTKGDLV